MPFLLLTAGFPGTGKTTVSAALAKRAGFVHCIADKIRREMTNGNPMHTWAETLQMLPILHAQLADALDNGQSAISDINYLKQGIRSELYEFAHTHNATPVTLWFECSLELALERNGMRSPSDAFFNDTQAATVRMMYAEREPLASWERAIIVHSANTVEENVKHILQELGRVTAP